MAKSMAEYLRTDMECEGLLECLHGLKELDRRCFEELVGAGDPMTVDDLADRVDRERSTVYRSLKRLLQAGLVEEEQINYDQGGYYHVYSAAAADEIAEDMQRLLDDWYARIDRLIGEFEDKYGDAPQAAAED